MQQRFYSQLPPGQFWMDFNDYLAYFRSTCISMDVPSRAHYQICSAGVDMKSKSDCFLSFRLEKPLDCHEDTLGIICEQQGNRMVTANLPAHSARYFTPSHFVLMLIFHDEVSG